MNNFLKWIEYLATEPDYVFQSVENGYFGQIYFTLHFRNENHKKNNLYENYFNSHINLTECEPKKLLTWYNNQTQYALNNGYKSDFEPTFYTAQHFLKLLKQLQTDGIDFKKYENYLTLIKLSEGGITLGVTQNKNLKNQYYWLDNDKDFRDLENSNMYKILLNFLKGVQNE